MCAVTDSLIEEGMIIGWVMAMKEHHYPDEEIITKIRERFQLSDYEARTFVYPREGARY